MRILAGGGSARVPRRPSRQTRTARDLLPALFPLQQLLRSSLAKDTKEGGETFDLSKQNSNIRLQSEERMKERLSRKRDKLL